MKTRQWSLPVISRAGRPVSNSPRNSAARIRAARGILIIAFAIVGLTAVAAISSFHGTVSHNAAKASTSSVMRTSSTGGVLVTGWMW